MENRLAKMMTMLVVAGLMAMGPVAYAGSQEEGPEADPGMHEPGPGDEGPGGGPGHHRGPGPKEFFKELGLTQEQQEKLEAGRKAQWAKSSEIREKLKARMKALHEEIGKPGMDRTQLNDLVAEINTLKGNLFSQHIEGILEMKKTLTPEQFAKMEAHFKEHGPGKRGGGKKHSRGPEGDQRKPEKD
ncbi:MAG: periplasmic heavy metal sensor [Candidatus Omnitrophota bacterium]